MMNTTSNSKSRRRWLRFIYVGLCQALVGWLRSRARGAQALLQPERSVPGGPRRTEVATAFRSRRFQSSIRAQGSKFPAQEVVYDGIDAHSAWRAQTAVEAMAQKRRRAADPIVTLRGLWFGLSGDRRARCS